ncbi:hypothetical protein ACP70R_039000 [Stipagrostis hirtigluma subsp. patula]
MAAEATTDWSSLPADLASRIADCFLAANDLDYYIDFRAVCHNWRAATTDPKTSQDPRFRPSRWIMLDEASSTDARVFVNTTTGRFLRKDLPLLRRYHMVVSNTGGFLVLADRNPPHAPLVLNPFTGSMIRFKAPPVRSEFDLTADVVGDSPTLLLATRSAHDKFVFHLADPDSEHFIFREDAELEADEFSDSIRYSMLALCSVTVELAPGEMAIVRKGQRQGVDLFRKNSATMAMDRVTSIGSRALFLGRRCVSIDAGNFPTIEANCVYYKKSDDPCMYMYDLALDEEERIDKSYSYPPTILQLIFSYTTNVPIYLLPWENSTESFIKSLQSINFWEFCELLKEV